MPMRTQARRHRIGIYSPGTGVGGPWRYIHSLLRGIDLDEFEVVVFSDLTERYEPRPEVRVASLGSADAAPRARLEAAPATGWRLPIPRPVRVWTGFARTTVRLARLIRPWNLDLFHTNNTGCEESPVAARLAGVPLVVGTFQVDPSYDLHGERSGPTHRLLERLSNGCLDMAIAISKATKAKWVERTRIPARRVKTIYHGIDGHKFGRRRPRAAARKALGLPAEGHVVVGGVGRLDEAKGFTYLIDAIAALATMRDDLYLVIAGEGPLAPALMAQAQRLGVADRLQLVGFQTDVQEVLDALDIFVMPSVCEAFGFALAEAMATELPAVGSAVGGIPEVMAHNRTGFVVAPRDSTALAKAIDTLISSPELAGRFGRAGRERVLTRFRESDMVDRTIALYRELLRPRRAARKFSRVMSALAFQ
ncbi:MAG TPA: glycosyltransferase family 4 protein [Gemmataceae bacterium]|nr:glycosyltransferase family 4 protein [Gemmataceae bacterium]